MIRFDKTNVFNFENALRGARNPMNSWGKIDSFYNEDGAYVLGENDLGLLQKLIRAGSDHRKFMRQIFVSVDVTAPLYWWKEYDTYKVGTTANSTSTMHKIHSKAFSPDDFSCEHLDESCVKVFEGIISKMESERLLFLDTKDKKHWWNIIQMLPSSYNQTRTCTMTYENLINMYYARKEHKLDEWRFFCRWIEELPYAEKLICNGSKI